MPVVLGAYCREAARRATMPPSPPACPLLCLRSGPRESASACLGLGADAFLVQYLPVRKKPLKSILSATRTSLCDPSFVCHYAAEDETDR